MNPILDNAPANGEAMLPDEALAIEEAQQLRTLERIEAFGRILARKRDEAITGRRNSGIEAEWEEDEDSYQGVDEANRDTAEWRKPSTGNGVLTSRPKNRDVRSTVFLNITRPYVDAAAAKVSDMLLPTDDRNWGIKPTPMPELSDMAKIGQEVDAQMQQAQQAQQPQQPGMPGQPQQALVPQPPQVNRESLLARAILDEATKRAEGAQAKIEDWLTECQYHAEVRKVIEDAAKLGTGILKGPFPVKRKSRSFSVRDGMATMDIVESLSPASRRIDPWNLFPDPACGEDIQNGNYVWERDFITARQLKELVGVPGYVKSQILKVLEEGPQKCNTTRLYRDSSDNDKFEIWYFTGIAEKDDLEAAGVNVGEEGALSVPAIVTMVNDCVIKGAISPLESGEFPYDLFPWQRRQGSPFGVGVARQVRTPQRMLNAATRGMMDNAGLSSGPQIVLRRGVIEPADGNWAVTPRKIWYAKPDADIQNIAQAFQVFSIETRQGELMNIIQFAMKLAEDVTGLPMILQGQQGQAPDTVGGMQILQNNASSVLRRLSRTFDDCITERHIRRYYEWLMLDPDVPDTMKGDFTIDARGSTALVERDIANQNILQMASMAVPGNPFDVDPRKWFAEVAKAAWRLDPKRFQYSDEEKAKLAQQPQPEPPQIAAAKINAESRLKAAEMSANVAVQRTQADTDRDRVYVEAETRRDMTQAQARREELAIKRELALLDYANKRQMGLDEVKSQLARDSMKLRTQRELALATTALKGQTVPQVASPATEPPGRAPNGQAFQR